MVLEDYGSTIYKKLYQLAVYAGIADESDDHAVAADKFISAIKDMKEYFQIGDTFSEIQKEDIPELSRYADKDANPLYPVPVLMNAKELEKYYYMLMPEEEK